MRETNSYELYLWQLSFSSLSQSALTLFLSYLLWSRCIYLSFHNDYGMRVTYFRHNQPRHCRLRLKSLHCRHLSVLEALTHHLFSKGSMKRSQCNPSKRNPVQLQSRKAGSFPAPFPSTGLPSPLPSLEVPKPLALLVLLYLYHVEKILMDFCYKFRNSSLMSI